MTRRKRLREVEEEPYRPRRRRRRNAKLEHVSKIYCSLKTCVNIWKFRVVTLERGIVSSGKTRIKTTKKNLILFSTARRSILSLNPIITRDHEHHFHINLKVWRPGCAKMNLTCCDVILSEAMPAFRWKNPPNLNLMSNMTSCQTRMSDVAADWRSVRSGVLRPQWGPVCACPPSQGQG